MSINRKRIRAILGPTNTGKTHYALERMLAYPSGIIGFPLRLLAKENYTRMIEKKGLDRVALITGEEKIIPHQAQWYSCTVEAMPTNIPTDFIAIDEIQICADPDRGHIFTQRLLYCRGNQETLFLGSETIKPILKRLIPEIEIETRPRLSSLFFSGYDKLTKLPPRSAVIAFSANEVYALAELVRRQHGGCAIIMGRLSPKTRNAQMQLYQNKEVDYLVATDAVGMGLNMDVDHIAFASLSKFDGHLYRNLNSSEAAQIAGRAGRGLKNGSFGTTGNCTDLNKKMIQDIETHQFNPLKHLFWRNHLLDFISPARLYNSLVQKPVLTCLKSGSPASDLQCLIYLIQDPKIISLCNTSWKTELLWENCKIPDFRKIGLDQHAKICKKTFLFLLEHRCIPELWFQHHINRLNCSQGDIDTLMQRLSGIRIFSYIATKNNWLENAIYWQKQTRDVENNLSDALHEQLVNRFVGQRATTLFRNLKDHNTPRLYTFFNQSGDIYIEGQVIGKITGFTFKILKHTPENEKRLIVKTIKKDIKSIIQKRVNQFIASNNELITFDQKSRNFIWENVAIAKLEKGLELSKPRILILDKDLLNNEQQHLVLKQLQTYLTHLARSLHPNLYELYNYTKNTPLNGIVYQLLENMGLLWKKSNYPLSSIDKKILTQYDIVNTHWAIYTKRSFDQKNMRLRALFYDLYHEENNSNFFPFFNRSHFKNVNPGNENFFHYLGWLKIDENYIRLDVLSCIKKKLHLRHKKTISVINKSDFYPLTYSSMVGAKLATLFGLTFFRAQSLSHLSMGPASLERIGPLNFHKIHTRKRINDVKYKMLPQSFPFSTSLIDLKQFYENKRHN